LGEKWEKSFAGDSANLDLDLYVFMRSSTWPDEIRRRGNQYDHPKFPVESGPDLADDILYGIGQCEKTLADPKTAPEERAVYLSWLIHLIGDEHMTRRSSLAKNPEKKPCAAASEADTAPEMNAAQNQFSLNRAASKTKFSSVGCPVSSQTDWGKY
jgi:hypothetical protein